MTRKISRPAYAGVRSIRAQIGVALAASTVLATSLVGAAPAGATNDAVAIGSGTKVGMLHADSAVDGGSCNVAAVGNDKFGNEVALTAGHCGQVGWKLTVDGQAVGTFATVNAYGGTEANHLDYAFVKLDDNAVMKDDPASPEDVKSIAAPSTAQFPVCKYGHGIANEGERCGLITDVTSQDFLTTILVTPFDSGSPVYVERTKLIGIVSRYHVTPPGVIMTRTDAAVADATAKNVVGAGFQPVA